MFSRCLGRLSVRYTGGYSETTTRTTNSSRCLTLKKDTLTPAIVADVLDCDPQYIRIATRQCPERLGFPVARIGNRVKIPRLAFIRWMEGEKEELV